MRGVNVGVLNGGRLAGLLVDGKHRDVAFTSAEQILPLRSSYGSLMRPDEVVEGGTHPPDDAVPRVCFILPK
jgi:hypothetical protein